MPYNLIILDAIHQGFGKAFILSLHLWAQKV